MKNFTKLMIMASFGVATLGYSQNYGYDQYSQQGRQYPSQQGYYSQPQQGYYSQQPQQGYNYQSQQGYSSQPYYNQPGAQQQGYMRGYSSTGGTGATGSSWSSWVGSDNKPTVPDDVISSTVTQNLRSTPYFSDSARNLQVMVKDGKVTLKGRVANKNEKNQIEYMVKNVDGVKSVSNDLETEQ